MSGWGVVVFISVTGFLRGTSRMFGRVASWPLWRYFTNELLQAGGGKVSI